jgi:hypothetical protein
MRTHLELRQLCGHVLYRRLQRTLLALHARDLRERRSGLCARRVKGFHTRGEASLEVLGAHGVRLLQRGRKGDGG